MGQQFKCHVINKFVTAIITRIDDTSLVPLNVGRAELFTCVVIRLLGSLSTTIYTGLASQISLASKNSKQHETDTLSILLSTFEIVKPPSDSLYLKLIGSLPG